VPIRNFDSGFWNDPSLVIKLPKDGKLLFAYLFTCAHCTPSGLYYIAEETIHNETGIAKDDLAPLFELLKPKIEWYPDDNLVWVKNFVGRQTSSPLFLKAVGKSLRQIHNETVVQTLLEYNKKKYHLDLEHYYEEADKSQGEKPVTKKRAKVAKIE